MLLPKSRQLIPTTCSWSSRLELTVAFPQPLTITTPYGNCVTPATREIDSDRTRWCRNSSLDSDSNAEYSFR